MWFYCSLFLLSGIMLHIDFTTGIVLLVIIGTSCIIKTKMKQTLLFGFIFVCIGYLNYPNIHLKPMSSFDINSKLSPYYNSIIHFTDKLKIDGDQVKAIGMINNQTYQIYYRIKNKQEKSQFIYNSPILKNCNIRYTFNNPLPNTNGLKFDYNTYLIQEDITGVINIRDSFLKTCSRRQLNLIETIQLYRESQIQRLKQLKIDNVDDIIAITLGETRYLSNERMEELKHIGIYHLYAVSGSHVAIISVFLFKLLLRFNIRYDHVESIVFCSLPVYAIMTGLSPSVLRAVSVVMTYILIKRIVKLDSIQILSITFIYFILYNPFMFFDIGFQLSYLISYFLLLSAPIIQSFTLIYRVISINIISQISSLIILIIHFNTFQWLGFLSNFIFIPLFELCLFPLLMCFLTIFSIFNDMPDLILCLVSKVLSFTIFLIEWFNRFNVPDLVVGNLNIMIYLCLFIILTIVSICILKKQIKTAFFLFVLTIICIVFPNQTDKVVLEFLDVGQGDSMYAFHMDTNEVVMIDTGGKVEVNQEKWQTKNQNISYTKSVLIPKLHEKGFNSIDYLIISHPHKDHMGELLEMAEQTTVKNLIINKGTWSNKELKLILNKIKENGTNILDSQQLKQIKVGNSLYKFYNQNSPDHKDKNETSILTEISVNKFKILSTGDATISNENKILKDILANYDILKVGHHGSLTSTSEEFLKKVNPKVCLISAGRHNRYGLPKKKTVNKLLNHGCKVYNTQHDGELEALIDKGNLKYMTGLSKYNKKAYKK